MSFSKASTNRTPNPKKKVSTFTPGGKHTPKEVRKYTPPSGAKMRPSHLSGTSSSITKAKGERRARKEGKTENLRAPKTPSRRKTPRGRRELTASTAANEESQGSPLSFSLAAASSFDSPSGSSSFSFESPSGVSPQRKKQTSSEEWKTPGGRRKRRKKRKTKRRKTKRRKRRKTKKQKGGKVPSTPPPGMRRRTKKLLPPGISYKKNRTRRIHNIVGRLRSKSEPTTSKINNKIKIKRRYSEPITAKEKRITERQKKLVDLNVKAKIAAALASKDARNNSFTGNSIKLLQGLHSKEKEEEEGLNEEDLKIINKK